MLPEPSSPIHQDSLAYVLGTDRYLCGIAATWLEDAGIGARICGLVEELAACHDPKTPGCIVHFGRAKAIRAGRGLYETLAASGIELPVVEILERNTTAEVVRVMRAGAFNALTKPLTRRDLVGAVRRAVATRLRPMRFRSTATVFTDKLAKLSAREREISDWVVLGRTSKDIARRLGISRRTVDFHRANILRKMQVENAPQLVHAVLTEGGELPRAAFAVTALPPAQPELCTVAGN